MPQSTIYIPTLLRLGNKQYTHFSSKAKYRVLLSVTMETEISNAYLDMPRTVMVNKENYYREYKGHDKQSLCQKKKKKIMHMLIISVLYVRSIRKLQ